MLISLDKIIKDYNLKIYGVLHVGAHYGEEYTDYIKHDIKHMMFFEPIESNFEELTVRLLPGMSSYNIALGNKTGEIEMYVETINKGQSCSILEPVKHLEQYPSIKFDKKEIVKIDKLDNIPFNRDFFNMINIDVQGYELEVFKGAVKTLPFIDIIYTEVNRDEVYKDCARVEDIDLFLADFGFIRILTDWTGDSWGDALYLKQ